MAITLLISSLFFWCTFFLPWSCPRTHICSPWAAASSEPPAFTSCYLLGSCKMGEKRHHLIPEGDTEWSLDGQQGGGSLRKAIICDCPGALKLQPVHLDTSRRGAVVAAVLDGSCAGSWLCALGRLWAQISEHRFGALPVLLSSRWNEAAEEDRMVGTHTLEMDKNIISLEIQQCFV